MQKPLIITFRDLAHKLAPLHLWHKTAVDDLHDIWKKGAPTPNSIVRNPVGYDPRKIQPGNYEARIVVPSMLTQWVIDVCKSRGITPEVGHQLIQGKRKVK
jgi:hypothetical protein